MNKKKAIICTIMLTIMVFGIYAVLMFVIPFGREMSMFHAFCPFIVGHWIGERICEFYDWLRKDK